MPDKLKGLTLMELMVSLVISIVIITFSFFSFEYLMKGYRKYQDANTEVHSQVEARDYLRMTIDRSDEVYKSKDGVAFVQNGKVTRSLQTSEKGLIIIGADAPDTVKVKISDFKVYWKKDSVLPDRSPVQRIKVVVDFFGKKENLIFEKIYDSEKLMRLDSLAETLQ
ncbi:MAG: PilW family protein [Bacteroidia bacterium]